MIARFLSINLAAGSSSNFTNVNNNGNLTNNNSNNSNGVVPDSLSSGQQFLCDDSSMEKEARTCGGSPNRSHDASHDRRGSCYQRGSFSSVIDPYSLLLAYHKCRKGVTWKGSVQNYEKHLIRNISEAITILKNGGRVTRGFYRFVLRERGKIRNISSVHISERVVQRSLCDNVLVPILAPKLIYDSGASIRGKGTSFARDRMKVHLIKHYRKYGSVGYIVTMDCSKYFDSIPHDKLFEMLDNAGIDDKSLILAKGYISDFGNKGLGLGSQVSQICSVFYVSKVDQYVKSKLKVSEYGRYMDDAVALFPTKAEARAFLDEMDRLYSEYGLTLNKRKTHIIKLTRGFVYLKMRFKLTDSGKVITSPAPDSRKRMARKLRKFYNNGMSFDDAEEAYRSWRGYWKSIDGNPMLTDRVFAELFGGIK